MRLIELILPGFVIAMTNYVFEPLLLSNILGAELVLIEPVCWSQDCVGLYFNMFSDQSGEHDL